MTEPNTEREIFLMSPPGPGWRLRGRANFRSDAAGQVDADRAFLEWVSLARAIEEEGGRVIALPSVNELTGLPYCAEAGHPLPAEGEDTRPRFLLPKMWAPHRTLEHEHWKPMLTGLGFRTISTETGLWEGQGDVASFRGTSLLFFGGRSDRLGLEAARKHFSEDCLCLEVHQPAFHGNVALLAVDSCDCIVVCPELLVGDSMAELTERFGKETLIPISVEEAKAYATNSLPVGSTLIAPTVAPKRVLRQLEDRGMRVVTLVMRELCEKAGGASRCLVCRVPAAIASTLVWQHHDWNTLVAEREALCRT